MGNPIEDAVLVERERCAKIAENHSNLGCMGPTAWAIAKKIRGEAIKELLPFQQEVLDSTEPEVLVTGRRGSGLSYATDAWLDQDRDHALLIVENHFTALDRCGRSNVPVAGIAQIGRLVGRRYSRVAFDIPAPGLDETTYLGVWDALRADRVLIATTPPIFDGPPRKHWIYDRFMALRRPDRRVIFARMDQNQHLDQRYRDVLKDAALKRWLDGSWSGR